MFRTGTCDWSYTSYSYFATTYPQTVSTLTQLPNSVIKGNPAYHMKIKTNTVELSLHLDY